MKKTRPQLANLGLSIEEKTFIMKVPPNIKGDVPMLNKDYTAKVLDLEDVIITNVENNCEELRAYIELPRKEHTCPVCGAVTDHVHDYRMQAIKDVPFAFSVIMG